MTEKNKAETKKKSAIEQTPSRRENKKPIDDSDGSRTGSRDNDNGHEGGEANADYAGGVVKH